MFFGIEFGVRRRTKADTSVHLLDAMGSDFLVMPGARLAKTREKFVAAGVDVVAYAGDI